eukprot:GSMAST32.ASY1.ANO1.1827.1 assembled CDS
MHADMKRKFMQHRHFLSFQRVFGPQDDNNTVYSATAKPLVNTVAFADGRCATAFIGKTFTMNAIYGRAARDLFATLDENFSNIEILAYFFIFYIQYMYDIRNYAPPLRVLEDGSGKTQLVGAMEVVVESAEDLIRNLESAMASRATAATGVHEHSSRSHAIFRITLKDSVTEEFRGMLMFVDLAGSERNADSWAHNAARRKECIQINVSLSALKECIRKRALGASHAPFRNSVLTRILKTSLLDSSSSTVVIATISPTATDTEHSHNTLRHACLMAGQKAEFGKDAAMYLFIFFLNKKIEFIFFSYEILYLTIFFRFFYGLQSEITGGAGGEICIQVDVKDVAVAKLQARMKACTFFIVNFVLHIFSKKKKKKKIKIFFLFFFKKKKKKKKKNALYFLQYIFHKIFLYLTNFEFFFSYFSKIHVHFQERGAKKMPKCGGEKQLIM